MGVITIHPARSTPLADQIVAALRRSIATGGIAVGQELPPVRQLAADLSVNLNTVARAYNVLQNQGLLQTARGRGTRITSERELAPGPEAVPLDERMLDVVADAKLAGLDEARVRALIEATLRACYPGPDGASGAGPNAGRKERGS